MYLESYYVKIYLHTRNLALLQAESDVTPLSIDKLVRLNHSIDCPVS
jgi:hypothetical protein